MVILDLEAIDSFIGNGKKDLQKVELKTCYICKRGMDEYAKIEDI